MLNYKKVHKQNIRQTKENESNWSYQNSSQFSMTLSISMPSPYNHTNPTLCAETEDHTIFTALLFNSIITKFYKSSLLITKC